MVRLDAYGQVAKKQEGNSYTDLLTKGFCFGNHFALAYRAVKSDVTFLGKVRAPRELKDTHAFIKIQEQKGEATLILQADSKGCCKVSAEFVPETNADLKLKMEFSKHWKTNAASGCLSLDHVLPDFRYKLSMVEGPVFKLNSVFGREHYGFGFDLGFDWMKSAITAYDGLFYIGTPASRCVVKYVSKPQAGVKGGDWELSGFREVSDRLSLAGKAVKPAAAQWGGEVGARWQWSNTRAMSAKVSQDGLVTWCCRQQLWQYATLLVSCTVSTAGGQWAPQLCGFKLKLNS